VNFSTLFVAHSGLRERPRAVKKTLMRDLTQLVKGRPRLFLSKIWLKKRAFRAIFTELRDVFENLPDSEGFA
jgi:hypothetical protein